MTPGEWLAIQEERNKKNHREDAGRMRQKIVCSLYLNHASAQQRGCGRCAVS